METGIAVLIPTNGCCLTDKDNLADVMAMERTARQRLEFHPHFRGHASAVAIRYERDVLILSGRVPSFYLKQLVQEVLRDLAPGIQNDVDVVCCDGLSSVHSSTLHA